MHSTFPDLMLLLLFMKKYQDFPSIIFQINNNDALIYFQTIRKNKQHDNKLWIYMHGVADEFS